MKMKTNEEFLKELNENLSKTISHKWRVQSFSKNKPSATVVAYIDSRDASDLLNEHAIYGWSDEYYEVAGNTYCKVGVVMPDGSMQWRSDCGVQSNQDAEKGQASDAFKRACVKWGIGRFLYNLGIEYVQANEVKTQSNFPYPVDEQGKRIWDLTKYINEKKVKSTDAWKTIPATMSYITGIAMDEPKKSTHAIQPNKSFESDDDRKVKALESLKGIASLNDQMQFIAKIAEFKKSNKVKGFKLGTSIEDLVAKNTLEAIIEFYKFVK